MSQEDVAVVRQMYDAFHGGDAEGTIGHFAPDVRVDARDRPDAVEEMRDLGDHVLVAAKQRGRGKRTGIETELGYALLYEVEDGRISSMTFYSDMGEALEAMARSE